MELVEFLKFAHNAFAAFAVVFVLKSQLVQIKVHLIELAKGDEVGFLQKRCLLFGKRGRLIIKSIKDIVGVVGWLES